MDGYLALTLRLLLAVVCLAASVGKLLGHGGPRAGLRSLRQTLRGVGLPRRLATPGAVGVIVGEVTVVALAPWPPTALLGSAAAVGLMAAFLAGVTWSVRSGAAARCNCFGTRGGELSRVHIARNATLTAIAVAAFVVSTGAGPAPVSAAGVIVVIVVAALAALVFVCWEDIAAVMAGGQPARRPAAMPKGRS